jgi:hypothetical protein
MNLPFYTRTQICALRHRHPTPFSISCYLFSISTISLPAVLAKSSCGFGKSSCGFEIFPAGAAAFWWKFSLWLDRGSAAAAGWLLDV